MESAALIAHTGQSCRYTMSGTRDENAENARELQEYSISDRNSSGAIVETNCNLTMENKSPNANIYPPSEDCSPNASNYASTENNNNTANNYTPTEDNSPSANNYTLKEDNSANAYMYTQTGNLGDVIDEHHHNDQDEDKPLTPCPAHVDIDLENNDEEYDSTETKGLSSCIFRCRQSLLNECNARCKCIKPLLAVLCAGLYLAYVGYAMYLHYDREDIWGLVFVTAILILVLIAKSRLLRVLTSCLAPITRLSPGTVRILQRCVVLACVVTLIVTIVMEVVLVRPSNLVSLSGLAGIVAIFFIISTHPHKVKWRIVLSGLFMQYIFALAILRVPIIRASIEWFGDGIRDIVNYSKEGEKFLFGENFNTGGFVFYVLPLCVFMLTVLSVLEHLGVLHVLMRVIGRILAACLGSSAMESFNAAANIFFGPIDAMIMIRPYLDAMSPSELHCLLSNGLSTVTGSILGLYIFLGVSADHLLAASVMSAPASLALAKLCVPETRLRSTSKLFKDAHQSRHKSVLDAASNGAKDAMILTGSIVGNVAAVVSVMGLGNGILARLGNLVDYQGLSLQRICSYLFYPLAMSLGVDVADGRKVAEMIGDKIFLNEIIAYSTLGQYSRNRQFFVDYVGQNLTDWYSVQGADIDDHEDILLPAWNHTLVGGFVTKRSEVITTYALCGFANFTSIGVLLGCFLALLPQKKDVVLKYIIRAMVTGNCASFLTGCIAGLLYHG